MSERYSRQEKYLETEKLKEIKVGIVGVGAVGSKVAELCARIGVGNIYLFDDDVVAIHNLTGQNFTESDVDRSKVMCIMQQLQKINSEIKIFAEPSRIVNEQQLPPDLDYLFSCVDLFKSRLTLIKYQKRINQKCIILDGGTSDESTTSGSVQMYNRQKGKITELKHFHPDLQNKLKSEEVMTCTEEVIPSLITTSAIVATLEVHWMLQHLKDGRIYEEMCQISLGKKPAFNYFEKK